MTDNETPADEIDALIRNYRESKTATVQFIETHPLLNALVDAADTLTATLTLTLTDEEDAEDGEVVGFRTSRNACRVLYYRDATQSTSARTPSSLDVDKRKQACKMLQRDETGRLAVELVEEKTREERHAERVLPAEVDQ